MGQASQLPKPAEHGRFLQQSSVGGTKVDFILEAGLNTLSSSFVIAAGSTADVGISAVLYDPAIPEDDRTTENIIPTGDCIGLWYIDFWVDTDNDFNYALVYGSSLSADQQLVGFDTSWDERTPATGLTQRRIYRFFNNGASPHTVYLRAKYRFMILASTN